MKILGILSLSVLVTSNGMAQNTVLDSLPPRSKAAKVYQLKPAIDIPVTAAAAGFTMYGFQQIYGKDDTPEPQIRALNKADINGIDRWAAGFSSDKAATASDKFFYLSMPLPLVLLASKEVRSDALQVGFLYLQAMSVTGLFYTGSATLVDRFRPLTYNTELPMTERRNGNNRNSFIAGHPALVATATFFTAKVFHDHHPDSKLRYLFWGGAAVATGTTAYLRHRAGKHFPTDLIAGTSIGVLSGILVPHFHKNKVLQNNRLSLLPYAGFQNGIAIRYTFK